MYLVRLTPAQWLVISKMLSFALDWMPTNSAEEDILLQVVKEVREQLEGQK